MGMMEGQISWYGSCDCVEYSSPLPAIYTVEEYSRSIQLTGEVHDMVGNTSRASDSRRWRGAIASSWVHAFTLRWLSTPAVCTGPDNAGTKGAKEREVRDHSSLHCTGAHPHGASNRRACFTRCLICSFRACAPTTVKCTQSSHRI